MFVSPALVNVDNTLITLLEKIDAKILCLAGKELDNIRFNVSNKIDYNLIEDLEDYKEIIKSKIMGCCCFDGTPIEVIGSRLNKILNKSC